MDPISSGASAGAVSAGSAEGSEDIALLKKSQDLMKDQAAQLLSMLPPVRPMSPNPPGVGGRVNLVA